VIELDPPLQQKLQALMPLIKRWSEELGFQQFGVSNLEIDTHIQRYKRWLASGFHGEMDYMQRQENLRASPETIHDGSLRVISLRMDYLPAEVETVKLLDHPTKAYVSRYALGRDYHKLIRQRLKKLADQIAHHIKNDEVLCSLSCSQRPFVDSAPVLERGFAEQAGLGWIGKNTMLINSKAGSWFFLGELFTSIPLPVSQPQTTSHCGSCRACMDICPTKAFDSEYVLDASKCISYLTIEKKGSIPEPYRKAIGNRIFGCDDCQLVCPWNKFAHHSQESDFKPRHNLDSVDLIDLFNWSEEEFDKNTQGSAIRRTGYENWLRNIAVALGNASSTDSIIAALKQRQNFSPLVKEHVDWALKQQQSID
jgi:epoxyqueuosine reductase